MIDQISKTKENKKIGELNQPIALYFWTMIDSFLINFIPSTIGCNKPNQPILYGPLLLCKPPITNRSIKANIPTVPSKNKIIAVAIRSSAAGLHHTFYILYLG